MPSFRFTINIPIDSKTIEYIEAASRSPLENKGTGWARPAQAAERVELLQALPRLQASLPLGSAALDVFTWDVILGELARYHLNHDKSDDLLWSWWAIRQAMHADARYIALLEHAKNHDRKQKRLEMIKKRHERDRLFLSHHS